VRAQFVVFCFSAQSHPAIASRMFARNRLQFEYAESGEKAAFWGLNRHFLGLKRGKKRCLQLLIRQQAKISTY
jgi:hypothetical protein